MKLYTYNGMRDLMLNGREIEVHFRGDIDGGIEITLIDGVDPYNHPWLDHLEQKLTELLSQEASDEAGEYNHDGV